MDFYDCGSVSVDRKSGVVFKLSSENFNPYLVCFEAVAVGKGFITSDVAPEILVVDGNFEPC